MMNKHSELKDDNNPVSQFLGQQQLFWNPCKSICTLWLPSPSTSTSIMLSNHTEAPNINILYMHLWFSSYRTCTHSHTYIHLHVLVCTVRFVYGTAPGSRGSWLIGQGKQPAFTQQWSLSHTGVSSPWVHVA